MTDIRLQAKLAKIDISPDKDGGDPVVKIIRVPEFTTDLMTLVPHVGKELFVTLATVQAEFAVGRGAGR